MVHDMEQRAGSLLEPSNRFGLMPENYFLRAKCTQEDGIVQADSGVVLSRQRHFDVE